jgi:phosphomannomutase
MTKTIVLFDMDGTLTPPRKEFDLCLLPALRKLSTIAEIGIVTGSDHVYVLQQMRLLIENSELRYKLHILPCNGTKYYPPPQSATRKHQLTSKENMRNQLGEFVFSTIMQYVLKRQSQLHLYDLPLTGHFVDYRDSMINWCPIGRNANDSDRQRFVSFDKEKNSLFREEEIISFNKFLFRNNLSETLTVKLGGETSFDIFPKGWDKTYCLRHFIDYKPAYFVGDRCEPNGNDWEIYNALNCNGRAFKTTSPKETSRIIFDELIPRIINDK